MSASNREYRLGAAFVALADTLVEDYDVFDLLDTLAGHCVSLLGVDGVGILLGDVHRELRVAAASNEDAATMGALQLKGDQGPCLDSFSTVAPVSAPDITGSVAAGRWPRFVGPVTELGLFRSVHAVPLRLRGQVIGAMGLFHRAVGEVLAADVALGQALADVATVGILSERARRRGEVLSGQLQSALDSRVVIEQAKASSLRGWA